MGEGHVKPLCRGGRREVTLLYPYDLSERASGEIPRRRGTIVETRTGLVYPEDGAAVGIEATGDDVIFRTKARCIIVVEKADALEVARSRKRSTRKRGERGGTSSSLVRAELNVSACAINNRILYCTTNLDHLRISSILPRVANIMVYTVKGKHRSVGCIPCEFLPPQDSRRRQPYHRARSRRGRRHWNHPTTPR